MNKGRWTGSDLQQLSNAIAQQRGTIKHGSAYTLNIDWDAVSAYIGNRSVSACINKYQKLGMAINFAKQKTTKEKVIDEITECHKCGKKVNGIKGLAGHSKFCKKFSKTASTDSIFESITQNDSTKTKNGKRHGVTSNDSMSSIEKKNNDCHVRYVTGNKKDQCKNNCPCKIKEIVMKGGLDLVLSYASKIEGVQASNSGDYFKTTNGNLYVQNLKK